MMNLFAAVLGSIVIGVLLAFNHYVIALLNAVCVCLNCSFVIEAIKRGRVE